MQRNHDERPSRVPRLDSVEGIQAVHLVGFFVGWPNPPSPATHLRILQGSSAVALACDESSMNVVGFATAISDGVLAAYIPLLEVLPPYQRRGIGSELIRRLLARFEFMYMVDVICDADVVPFYERCGLRPMGGMGIRNFAHQAGSG